MIWRYVEKKVKDSFYPDLYYWSQNLPRSIRTSIYNKYNLNIRFEFIPENLRPMLYYWYFGKCKGYYYPTDDNIKFFYFTLFKKNGFIFLILCYLFYRNYFLEFLTLVTKSGIAFYLIIYFIYILLFMRKIIRVSFKVIRSNSVRCLLILLLISINESINILYSTKKNGIS